MKIKDVKSFYNTPLEDILYQLNYIKGNVQQFKLVKFNKEVSLEEAVRAAKQYCAMQNYRFVFIEPAIITIDLETDEGEKIA